LCVLAGCGIFVIGGLSERLRVTCTNAIK